MQVIDVVIVAARKPSLLRRTLDNFSRNLIPSLAVKAVYANIDPVFGSREDQAESVAVIREHWPSAHITEPTEACFGAAVKRLWGATTADYVLHHEDDWVLTQPVGPEVFLPFETDASIAQVPFHAESHHYDVVRHGHVRRRVKKLRVLKIKLFEVQNEPHFSTSPCIMRGSFARGAANLMDPTLDPEKQFSGGWNKPLEAFVKHSNAYIFSPHKKPILLDIGREWRDERKITKTITNARSTWSVGSGD